MALLPKPGIVRAPLTASHAGDLYAAEQAGLAKRFIARERLGIGQRRHIQDQHATDARGTVFGQRRPAKDQLVLVMLEIGEMLILHARADREAVGAVFLVDDIEHEVGVRTVLWVVWLGWADSAQPLEGVGSASMCSARATRVCML